MIQTALTYLFNAAAILAIAYLFVSFTGFIMSKHRRRVSPGQLSLFDIETAPVDHAEPFDDLLTIEGDSTSITLRDCTIRQLKALASLYQVPKFNTLRKADLNPIVMSAIAA